MFGNLESIGVKCGPVATGSLTHLYLIGCDSVAFDVYPDQLLTAANPLWLSGAKVVTEIKLRAKTATFSEGLQNSPAGASYNPQVSVPIPSIASEIVEWVYRNHNRRFIAIFRDTAGFCYMAGTKSNGLRLSWARSVSQTSSQQLSVSGVNWHPALWMGSVDPEVLFPTKEFDYSFDISFS
ncbi:hypothetical protein [Dyadobacter sp. 22481]|uniref:hypothetical protein n=1 Tax=Dyadobacter sp. 22481 TaxID=3453926 RepID=UPI003F8279D4